MRSLYLIISTIYIMQCLHRSNGALFEECYPGDVNLAILPFIRINCPGVSQEIITTDYLLYLTMRNQFIKLNRDPNMLFSRKNIRLGYVVKETCSSPVTVAEIASRLRPSWIATEANGVQFCHTIDPYLEKAVYSVVGGVGPATSAQAAMFSYIEQNYHMFSISPTATSDDFTDSKTHEYLLRMVPPDSLQATAVVDILIHFNWKYVILLYSDDEYGRNLLKNFYKTIQRKFIDICVAFEASLTGLTLNHNDYIIRNILKYTNTKIIVYFGSEKEWIFDGLIGQGYLFISTDTIRFPKKYAKHYFGSLKTDFKREPVPEVISLFNNLTYDQVLQGSSVDKMHWEKMHNCSFTSSIRNCSLHKQVLNELSGQLMSDFYLHSDAIEIFASIINEIMSTNCSHIQNAVELNECIKPEILRAYFHNMQFSRTDGLQQKFTETGYIERDFMIYQLSKESTDTKAADKFLIPVGKWSEKDGLIMDYSKLIWNDGNNSIGKLAISSKCSAECLIDEIKITINNCCWECRKCRKNEAIANNSYCEVCPLYYWPDDTTKSYCRPIFPHYVELSSSQFIFMSLFAIIGLISSIIVILFYISKRDNQLIKASAFNLSRCSLVGIALGFITMLMFVGKPNLIICSIRNVFYHLSSTIPFSGMLVKTNRIYRVFTSSKKGCRTPPFVSARAVMLIFSSLVIIQMLILLVTLILFPQNPEIRMPNPYEPFIETNCPTSKVLSFWIPFGFNLALLLLCSTFAFFTRSLPDNFHDSKCIFASAAACCFIWIAFIPSLVTSTSGTSEDLLLSLAQGVSSVVVLSTAFLSKVYGVISNKDSENIQFYGTTRNTIAPN